jgi:glycosidase
MRKQIGYVKDLGFDAVWISPFTQQGSDAFGMSECC